MDLDAAASEDVGDEIVREAAESVAVGHVRGRAGGGRGPGHAAYTSRKREVQKPRETPATEVDAAGNVGEDAADVPGVRGAERRDLALEVGLLLARGDGGTQAARREGGGLPGCGRR